MTLLSPKHFFVKSTFYYFHEILAINAWERIHHCVEITEFYCHSLHSYFADFPSNQRFTKNFTVNQFDEKKFAWQWISRFSTLCIHYWALKLQIIWNVGIFLREIKWMNFWVKINIICSEFTYLTIQFVFQKT